MMSSGGALVNMYTTKPASPTITPTSASLNPAANANCNAAASYLGLWSNTGFCSSASPSYPYAQAPGTAPAPYSKATGAVAVRQVHGRWCRKGFVQLGEEVETALTSGLSALRSAYAYAYGFECTSGNLAWLRRKVEEAVDEDMEDE